MIAELIRSVGKIMKVKKNSKNHEIIRELKQFGYDVKVFYKRNRCNRGRIQPRGGVTLVSVIDPNGQQHIGESICSKADTFNKKLGVRIALGRALKSC